MDSSTLYDLHIRPGAVRIGCSGDDANVKCIAFRHNERKTETVLLLNRGGATTARILPGGNPAAYEVYQTSATQNARHMGVTAVGADIQLPAKSVTTLFAKNAATQAIRHSAGRSVTAKRPGHDGTALSIRGLDGRRLMPSANTQVPRIVFDHTGRLVLMIDTKTGNERR